MKDGSGRGRRVFTPQQVDQPVRGEGLADMQTQRGEECPLTRGTERDRAPHLVHHLDRTEETELHTREVLPAVNIGALAE